MRYLRIISGGQTGIDRAALDWALENDVPCGGWVPRGRWAEDGPLPTRYPLQETGVVDPAVRTARNVRDSDGTLVLYVGEPCGGTELTLRFARCDTWPGGPRAMCCVSLDREQWAAAVSRVVHWMRTNCICTLNVAGPRESEAPGIEVMGRQFLDLCLEPGSAS